MTRHGVSYPSSFRASASGHDVDDVQMNISVVSSLVRKTLHQVPVVEKVLGRASATLSLDDFPEGRPSAWVTVFLVPNNKPAPADNRPRRALLPRAPLVVELDVLYKQNPCRIHT